MKLIIGLGNPEPKYNGTRHNTGFSVLDEFARINDLQFQTKSKFQAEIAELNLDGEKVILAKPTTYYNLSGEAVRALADFYKTVSENILVIHDELALPFGAIRTRLGGSDAGNNGIKSINQHLGPNTARIRVGIYNEQRQVIGDVDFVIGQFSQEEREQMPALIKKATDLINSFIAGKFETTTHK